MTAENHLGQHHLHGAGLRFNEAAADDRGKPIGRGPVDVSDARFNEAAADDRGKRPPGRGARAGAPPASMRPRPMTAENSSSIHSCGTIAPCFNEAAADDRGKPRLRRPSGPRSSRFNEAAADDRGKRAGRRDPAPRQERLQ